jgi:hypothetical protein
MWPSEGDQSLVRRSNQVEQLELPVARKQLVTCA